MRAACERFLFAPAAPAGLGITRALLYGGLLALYARTGFADYADVSEVFRCELWFRPPVAPEAWLVAAHRVWLVALALACVGIFSRAAMAISFALGTYLFWIDGSFGRVHHNELPVVLALGVFAASRAGDAFSLDALRRRARPEPSGEYRWPLRAVQIALALAFLAAGIAKLRNGGLEWITTDNLRLQFLGRSYSLVPASGRNLLVARMPLLCNVLAAATVACELLYGLSLVSARARMILVPASLAMIQGFATFFGPRFTTFMLLSVVWLPWDRLLRHRPRGSGSSV